MRQLKKLIPLLSGYKMIFILAMITVTLSQLFYAAGPLILSTAIDSIIGSSPAANPVAMWLMDLFGGRDSLREGLWIIGVLIVANTIFRGVFLYLKGYYSAKASENVSMNLRDRLYDHIQKLPYSYHVKTDTGDLIQRCTSDVETIRRFLGVQLVEVAGSLSMLFFILWSMLSLHRGMTLYSMILVPVIFGFAYAFFKRIQRDFKDADEAEAKLSTTLQENLTGIRVVKAFAREPFELEKFDVFPEHVPGRYCYCCRFGDGGPGQDNNWYPGGVHQLCEHAYMACKAAWKGAYGYGQGHCLNRPC